MKLFIFWMHIIQTDNLHSKAQYSSLLPSTAQNIPVRTVQYSPVAAQHIPVQYSPLQSTSAQLQPIILANTVTTVPHHPFQKPRSLLFLVLQPTAQCWSSFNRYNFKSRNQQWMMSDKYFLWIWVVLDITPGKWGIPHWLTLPNHTRGSHFLASDPHEVIKIMQSLLPKCIVGIVIVVAKFKYWIEAGLAWYEHDMSQ